MNKQSTKHEAGSMRLIKRSVLFFAFLCAFFILPVSYNNVLAQNQCTIQNPVPGAEVLAWLNPRPPRGNCTSREHLGVDIMLDMCLPVENQQGCEIVMNGDSPLFGQPGTGPGYGYWVRYRCNENVEVRFTHLNSYDGNAKMPINGRSGFARDIPPHIHYEVYVQSGSNGPRNVDPECVWGTIDDPSKCCLGTDAGSVCGLGSAPADMCDPVVLKALHDNHDARAFGGSCNRPPNGYTGEALADGIPYSQIPPGLHGPEDMPCDSESPTGPVNNVIEDEDIGSFVPVVVNPGETLENPPDPQDTPPTPGTPKGAPVLVPLYDTPPPAGTIPLSGCATDTWTAMVNQAALESRRELVMNQRLIAKADSVLTYSCFDTDVAATADNIGPIFSETDHWANATVNIIPTDVTIQRELGDTSLDSALSLTVDTIVAPYLASGFSHGLAGETVTVPAPSGTDCDVMNVVWQAAKCKNAELPFYKFEDLIGVDPRNVPANLDCNP